MKTISSILLVFFFLLLSACAANPATTTGTSIPPGQSAASPALKPPAASVPQQTATLSPARPATVLPTTAPQSTSKPNLPVASPAPAAIQKMLGDQAIQINAQEMMTVSTPTFNLTGQAPTGSVISVNNDFIVIGGNRAFSFPINLEEGPNLLEVVASNAQGQQVSVDIVVVYDTTP